MLESLKHEELQFQELSPEEKQARGILARLTGPIASFTKGTRNGRKYSDKLWEKAFDAPLVKEMFKSGGLPGELQHPENRSETDPTKIAIMMPEPPKKDSKGHLVASVDILDTPCGQIAYQLGKYGFKFGISSRGEGDLITDFSGEESVDPDTYTLNAFDLVLIPACEDARLKFSESLEMKPKNNLRKILSEALESASDTDRRIMEEALEELNIDDNYQFVETYHDEDIYFDPETKKYIVGYADNHTVLNSVNNAKEYIDRYMAEGVLNEEQAGREETKSNEMASEILKNKPQPEKEEEQEVNVNVEIPEKKEDDIEEDMEHREESLSLNEGKEYTLTFHDGPTGNLRKTLDIYAKNSDEAFSKGYEYARNNDLTSQGYTEVTCQEKSPDGELCCYGAEVEARDGFGNTRTYCLFFLANNKSDVEDFIYSKVIGEVTLDPNGRLITGENNWGKSAAVVEEVKSVYEATGTIGINVYNDDMKYTTLSEDIDEEVLTEDSLDDAGVYTARVSDIANNRPRDKFNISNRMIQGKDLLDYFDPSDKLKIGTIPGEVERILDRLTEAIEWTDLNGTEQSAVEAALAEINNGSDIEDAVHGAVARYNEENANPDYEDEDFYMEEANFVKVLEYVRTHNTDTLTEAKFGMFKNEGNEETAGLEEGAIVPKRNFELVAKPFSMTMYYKGEEAPIESAVVVIPNAIKYDDGTVTDGVVACEDPDTGEVINFKTVDEAQGWIDSFGEDCLYRMDGGTLHATPRELYDIDKAIELEEAVIPDIAADDDGAIVEQLQNILKENKSLENKVKALQEKISAGYAKEMSLKEELDNYKQKASKLSEKSKEIKVLKEKLSKAEAIVEDNKSKANDNISTLNESIEAKAHENKTLRKDISVLNEALDKKNSKIKSLNEQISNYKDELRSKDTDIEQLKEQYETGQKDLEQLKNRYSKKLEEQNQTIEKYQRVAKNSVKKYIESQAIRLGVKSDEIVNRLPKNYSFNDIDIICEDLQEYKFNISNLPFGQYGLNENLKVTAKNINKGLIEANPEDEITDYDLKIAEAFL